jgi:DNA-binding CsgD family transcriptional regulator
MLRKTMDEGTRLRRPAQVDLLERNREILRLHDEEGMTPVEISRRLRLSPNTVRSAMYMMRRGRIPRRRFRGTTVVTDRTHVFACPTCEGLASRVVLSTTDAEGTPIRLRICSDCGTQRPTVEVTVFDTPYSRLDDRARNLRGVKRRTIVEARVTVRTQ